MVFFSHQTPACDFSGTCDSGETPTTCPSDCKVVASGNNTLENVGNYISQNAAAVMRIGDTLKTGDRLNSSCGIGLQLTVWHQHACGGNCVRHAGWYLFLDLARG